MKIKPEMKDMHCPFLRTVLSAPDGPKWDRESQLMEVEELLQFVRNQPGHGDLADVVCFFSVANHGLGNRIQRLGRLVTGAAGQFSTNLRGSDGDHEGDSRIYNRDTGEFDAEQFRVFTSFSTDGQTMDVNALGRAIANANKRHNGSAITAVQSAGEFGLLCTLLGNRDGTIRIADMRRLYEENQFPDAARENLGSRTSQMWLDVTRRIVKAVSRAAAGAAHRQQNMNLDSLNNLLEVLFSPLLRTAR
jgi:hypothetical protein